jgi:catalase
LPAHAKGRLLSGTFTPTSEASALSKAPHFNAPSTPLTLRFSSSTGFPDIPDSDPQSNPRGIAIRFQLPEKDGRRHHTDIIAHSTKHFPTRTGAEFLEFLQAATSPEAGTKVPEFLGRHPETVIFLQDPKPSPVSFATQHYFGVNAFKFVNSEGNQTFVRYRVEPVLGVQTLSADETKAKGKDYLFEELAQRIEAGSFEFKLLAQVADEGDVTDNSLVLWPEERKLVELGTVKVEGIEGVEESLEDQKKVRFLLCGRLVRVRRSLGCVLVPYVGMDPGDYADLFCNRLSLIRFLAWRGLRCRRTRYWRIGRMCT